MLRECGAHWEVKGYSCRMSLLGVVRDELGSEAVFLRASLLGVVRDEVASEGVLLSDEFVKCSAGSTGQ